MPTYEYECGACGHRFDEFQSITAKSLRKCPACGRLKLQRLIGTGGAIIFKGGGFYETDYRSDGYRKAEEAERKSGEKKAEPATKSEASSTEGKSKTGSGTESAAASSGSAPAAKASESAAGETKASRGGGDTPAKKPSGKRHAREGRGVGNLSRTSSTGASRGKSRTKAAGRSRRRP